MNVLPFVTMKDSSQVMIGGEAYTVVYRLHSGGEALGPEGYWSLDFASKEARELQWPFDIRKDGSRCGVDNAYGNGWYEYYSCPKDGEPGEDVFFSYGRFKQANITLTVTDGRVSAVHYDGPYLEEAVTEEAVPPEAEVAVTEEGKKALSCPPGTKKDAGKARWDLLPIGIVEEAVQVLTFGAEKYAPGNWQKVPDGTERYYAALMRHIAAWRKGEKKDGESGLSHLAHAMANIIFLEWFENEA